MRGPDPGNVAHRSLAPPSALTRLRAVLAYPSEPTELFLSVGSIFWGGWLLLPFDTFPSAPAYNAMALIAPEPVWGLWFVLVGIAWFAGLLAKVGRWRRWCALAASWDWCFVAVCFGLASGPNTGVVTYSFVAAASAWAYLRLSEVIR